MVDFRQACLTVLSTTVIKTANKGIAFGRMVFNTSGRERERLGESVPRRILTVLVGGGPVSSEDTCVLAYPLICQLSV